MRGEIKKDLRRRNLLLLHESFSWEEIASASNTNSSYLSQIANSVIQRGGKTPRGLSDNYAEKIENGLQLPPGWMDEHHGDPDTELSESPETYIAAPYKAGNVPFPSALPGHGTRGFVPLIDMDQINDLCADDDNRLPIAPKAFLPCPTTHSTNTFAVRIEGDSMVAPFGRSYPAGCIVYVDPNQVDLVVSGERVIAELTNTGDVLFIQFVDESGRRFLRPLNPQYPIITDEFRIIGKVIGSFIPE